MCIELRFQSQEWQLAAMGMQFLRTCYTFQKFLFILVIYN